MSEDQDDKRLVRNLKNGDILAFDELYRKFNKKIYSFSLSYLKNKDEAEGIVQEVFLRLWRNRAELQSQYNIDSYLFKITYNLVMKHFRNLSREKKHLEEFSRNLPDMDDSASSDLEYQELLDLTEKAIKQLPERQKAVYQLNMRDGLTVDEISGKLGISRRTAENHLHRAKAYLKNALSDQSLKVLLFIWLFVV